MDPELDDASAVLTWTAEHAAGLGTDPARIAGGRLEERTTA